MGILRSEKNKNKKAKKDFEERLERFVKEMDAASKFHRIKVRPFIGKYGAEMEFLDMPEKSPIILPK